tara:strand:+ start:47 stop:451 length:405 start_codon:yes stop_codon:yes gene_type:complete
MAEEKKDFRKDTSYFLGTDGQKELARISREARRIFRSSNPPADPNSKIRTDKEANEERRLNILDTKRAPTKADVLAAAGPSGSRAFARKLNNYLKKLNLPSIVKPNSVIGKSRAEERTKVLNLIVRGMRGGKPD